MVASQPAVATAAAVQMTPPAVVVDVVRMTLRAMSVAGRVLMTPFHTCVDHVAQTMHLDMCAAVTALMIPFAAAAQMTS